MGLSFFFMGGSKEIDLIEHVKKKKENIVFLLPLQFSVIGAILYLKSSSQL